MYTNMFEQMRSSILSVYLSEMGDLEMCKDPEVEEEVKKFMDAIHAKVSSINRTIGQLESPYKPSTFSSS